MALPVRMKTPDLIVETAEALWGERGVDAVSLREISVAAGLSNPASVQYHFGSRDALIWAIFSSRLPDIDARREELMAELGEDSIRGLLDCLFRPLFEQRNAQGRHSYAAFLRQVLRHDAANSLRARAMDMTPATAVLLLRLRGLRPALPDVLASHRLIAINLLVLDVIDGVSRELPTGLPSDSFYDDAIEMAAAAFAAPLSGSSHREHGS